MIREIVTDALGRWTGESDPQCTICQCPLPQQDAVDLDGEPVHRGCVRGLQSISRRSSRRDRAMMGPWKTVFLYLIVYFGFILAMLIYGGVL